MLSAGGCFVVWGFRVNGFTGVSDSFWKASKLCFGSPLNLNTANTMTLVKGKVCKPSSQTLNSKPQGL